VASDQSGIARAATTSLAVRPGRRQTICMTCHSASEIRGIIYDVIT